MGKISKLVLLCSLFVVNVFALRIKYGDEVYIQNADGTYVLSWGTSEAARFTKDINQATVFVINEGYMNIPAAKYLTRENTAIYLNAKGSDKYLGAWDTGFGWDATVREYSEEHNRFRIYPETGSNDVNFSEWLTIRSDYKFWGREIYLFKTTSAVSGYPILRLDRFPENNEYKFRFISKAELDSKKEVEKTEIIKAQELISKQLEAKKAAAETADLIEKNTVLATDAGNKAIEWIRLANNYADEAEKLGAKDIDRIWLDPKYYKPTVKLPEVPEIPEIITSTVTPKVTPVVVPVVVPTEEIIPAEVTIARTTEITETPLTRTSKVKVQKAERPGVARTKFKEAGEKVVKQIREEKASKAVSKQPRK